METEMKKVTACPTCGVQLESDGAAFRCPEHGLWYAYSANLLVQAPSDEYKTRDRFTMPWESLTSAT